MSKKELTLLILKICTLLLMVAFLISFVFLLRLKTVGLIISVIMIVIVFILYITMHIIRSKTYSYTCPKCTYKFEISPLKDITSFHAGEGARVLICPKCHIKEVMKPSLIIKK